MAEELYAAILHLKTKTEAARFFRDLLTLPEIREFSKRFRIAKALYLKQGSYQTIARKLHVSTTTVTRVAQWLHHGRGGYKLVLDRS
jgi:TrpR-related protein YerC/YecD